MIVTAIIVFGSDLDVFYAMPLGVFAGALATLFAAFAEHNAPKREPVRIRIRR
jgi:energy-converting hydrogenase Eha subunit A